MSIIHQLKKKDFKNHLSVHILDKLRISNQKSQFLQIASRKLVYNTQGSIHCSVNTWCSRGVDGYGVRGRFRKKGTYVYLWLIHVAVWQKPTQHCSAIIFQLKIDKFKRQFTKSIYISTNTWEKNLEKYNQSIQGLYTGSYKKQGKE